MHCDDPNLEKWAIDAVLADPVCATLIDRLPALDIPNWWLTGGAVFQNVWNAVEGRPAGEGVKDYDIFYYDDRDLSWEAEDVQIKAVRSLVGDDVGVEVKNQARVHLWYEERFGAKVDPLRSATEAIDGFASTTCSVGITNDGQGIRLYAPQGLQDVFDLHMRPNHEVPLREVYAQKVLSYRERWPSVTADLW